VEVTSESTADRDHQEKLEAYLTLKSLREYWIASPSRALVTQYVRRGDEWVVRSVADRDARLRCNALDLELSSDAIYALVDTDDGPAAPDEADDSA
jgi:Uma2 family endonuclease